MFKEIGDERTFNGILNQITDNIQRGRLKAGDALPAERTMAETMGVSRPAVREALRALELLGIIKPVPGGGNYIADDLDSWLIGPLSILFKLNNVVISDRTSSFVQHSKENRRSLQQGNVHHWMQQNFCVFWLGWIWQRMRRVAERLIKNYTQRLQRLPTIR